MSQESKPTFLSPFRRRSSRRLSGNGDEGNAATNDQQTDITVPLNLNDESSGLAAAGDSYGSLSNESINDTELGDGSFISPTSSANSSRRSLVSPRTLMSPLLGENLLDTDAEDEISLEQDLLPGATTTGKAAASSSSRLGIPQPPRLDLPPIPRRPSSASPPPKAYPDSYQNQTTPRGGRIGGGIGGGSRVAAESPSSVNAQPGDWDSVGKSYGTGSGVGGGDGTSPSNGSRGGPESAAPRFPILMNMTGTKNGQRGKCAILTRIVIVAGLLLLTTILAIIMSNSSGWWSSSNGASSDDVSVTTTLAIPFPKVDRAAYGDPAEKIVDTTLFDPRLLGTPSSQSQGGDEESKEPGNTTSTRLRHLAAVKNIQSATSLLKVPFPTGAFWTNLVLKSTTDNGLSYPIFAYPYGYKWSASKLLTSYPPLRRKIDSKSIRDVFQPDLTFGSAEEVLMRHVVSFDPLSVSVRFLNSEHQERTSYWESYIVRGSPYVTIKYRAATPMISPLSNFKSVMCPRDDSGNYKDTPTINKAQVGTFPQATKSKNDTSGNQRLLDSAGGTWGVCSMKSGGEPQADVTLTGVQFLFQTQENLTWLVFASSPITLIYDAAGRRTVKSSKPFTGVLRFALVPPPVDDDGIASAGSSGIHDSVQLSASSGVKRLIYHASIYPVAGHVAWEFQKETTLGGKSNLNQALSSVVGDGISSIGSTIGTIASGSTSSNKYATVKFEYDILSMSDTAQQSTDRSSLKSQLLMLALPHHADQMSTGLLKGDQFDLGYQCIKGMMQPVVGDSWQYQEALPALGFDDDETLLGLSTMDDTIRDSILDQVKKDLVRVLPAFDENVYGFGKQTARLAQLVHIGHMLSLPSANTKSKANNEEEGKDKNSAHPAPGFVEDGLDSLRKYVCTFLRDGQKDKLFFDSKFGGMVTKDGLEDTQADFGNGRFNVRFLLNVTIFPLFGIMSRSIGKSLTQHPSSFLLQKDHHFHYGYLLYASAILAKYDAHFLHDYGPYVDSLLFDVAYSSNSESGLSDDDNFFPFTRHLNWFDGHSFASGLFPYGNGKSQESSSEAVNCYYGAYLWSKVRFGDGGGIDSTSGNTIGGKGGTDFARLLLAMELRGARTYWHMLPSGDDKGNSSETKASSVYNNRFAKNYMVGNLGMLDAVCSTWFGTNPLYVHMINFVPLTAATSLLFDVNYVKEEYKNALSKLYDGVEMAWKGYVVADRAIVDPNGAWKDAKKLISYELDAALSLSQLLYFISTRKEFSASSGGSSSGPDNADTSSEPSYPTSSSSSACEVHSGCVDLGLSGECCPTSGGLTLGCCQESGSEGSEEQEAPAPSPSSSSSEGKKESTGEAAAASCEAHFNCVEVGLSGDCCPTASGIILGCCGDGGGDISSSESNEAADKTTNADDSGEGESGNNISGSSCSVHPQCADAGLTGNCCPTDAGNFLECCS